MELYNRAMRLRADIQTATAKQLSSRDAVQFLHRCTERLRLRPKDAYPVIGWIRAILKFHAAYLMSSPDAQKSISHVYQVHHCLPRSVQRTDLPQMIETRLAMFDSLMSLSGRIDLLLTQVEQKEKTNELPPQETLPEVPTSTRVGNGANEWPVVAFR